MKHKVFCHDCGGRVWANDPVSALRWHRRFCVPRVFRRWPRDTVVSLDYPGSDGRGWVRDNLWKKGSQ